MKKAILGTKLGMTQMFREDGTMIPVTVVLAGPCPVVQKKSVEHDGYEAVQVAFKPIREKLCTKPMLGHFKKAGVEAHRYTREFKFDDTAAYEVGQVIKADIFANGDHVDVTATSKGKGFEGLTFRMQVDPLDCQGCGACTVTCPSGAMDLKGFANKQILAEVDAICR